MLQPNRPVLEQMRISAGWVLPRLQFATRTWQTRCCLFCGGFPAALLTAVHIGRRHLSTRVQVREVQGGKCTVKYDGPPPIAMGVKVTPMTLNRCMREGRRCCTEAMQHGMPQKG